MGSRDIRQREVKKPKKDSKKAVPLGTLAPTPEVEVVKRPRKPKEEEE